MYKKCKVVILPTNKEVKIDQIALLDNRLITIMSEFQLFAKPQHLYILSDDEIKEGDWFYNLFSNIIGQSKLKKWGFDELVSKIISSTDPSFRIYGEPVINGTKTFKGMLPSLHQSFIEEYVSEYNAGRKIEEVMVEYDKRQLFDILTPQYDRIVESLKINKDNTITIKRVKDSWTRDEAIELCENAYDSGRYSIIHKDIDQTFDKWIEKNL